MLAILLEVPFLFLCPFLETSGLVNHQYLMLFLDFYLRRFQHHEELGNRFRHPLHTIVHHEVLVTLVMVAREFCQSLFYLEDQLPLDSSDGCTQTI